MWSGAVQSAETKQRSSFCIYTSLHNLDVHGMIIAATSAVVL